VYIYNQQLHTNFKSDDNKNISEKYKTITVQSYIDTYKKSEMSKLQQEYIQDLNSVFDTLKEIDENTIFNLENIFSKKNVDIDFYIQEIEVSFNNVINKIQTLLFNEIQSKLKKAEIIKDNNLINKYIQDINTLWQNQKK
jgi:flagellin-like hook-associated protein FlgL